DLLFSMVNIARFLDLRSEEVLTRAIERFIQRFGYIETRLREAGKTPAASTLEEMDTLWNEAKQRERKDTNHLRQRCGLESFFLTPGLSATFRWSHSPS